jgi:hypothetical protein
MVFAKLWRAWKQFGQFIGDFIARIFLTVFYFTVFVPFALMVRWGQDPLQLKATDKPSFWLKHESQEANLSEARRLF